MFNFALSIKGYYPTFPEELVEIENAKLDAENVKTVESNEVPILFVKL